jgi:integrase
MESRLAAIPLACNQPKTHPRGGTKKLGRSSDVDSLTPVGTKSRAGYRKPRIWDVDLTKPMGEWKKAWAGACKEAKIRYRWHDLRHTFISRLAENPVVSEGTLTSLAGHVSKRMLERYSHIRTHAKRAAIEALEQAQVPIPAVSGAKPSEAQTGAILGEGGHEIGHTE